LPTIEISLVILAIYFTLIITTGIFSSWEYAAILAALLSLVPLILIPKEYIEFLKTPLFDMEVFKITNFSAILLFDSVVIAYAFNAWIRAFFIAAFIALIAYKLGFLTPAVVGGLNGL